ncbi:MAG: peptidoglycan bridge formation glycyltransferase FemA/FemB family protein, partial [Alistipes sp.]|nr:peptidoglycan bridge formation glycyltransferase FemA/FemB family protein [Alistipes sp.]
NIKRNLMPAYLLQWNAIKDAKNFGSQIYDFYGMPPTDDEMDAAACVGCGACAATCKNGSAMLFVAARVSSLAKLPQGRVEGARRAKAMVAKMDELGFGNCTNTGACQAQCPKQISIAHIARLNREFLAAKLQD